MCLQAPDADALSRLLSRIPQVVTIVIVSPHGYFGQQNVLGLPDTGGQIVYILDQVRALAQEMKARLAAAGVEHSHKPEIIVLTRQFTSGSAPRGSNCHMRWETISGTGDVAHILRVPFRDAQGRTLEKWVSRFDLWPYLEQFTLDAQARGLNTI